MACLPRIPKTPLELLAPSQRPEPFLNKIWAGGLLGTFTFACICYINYAVKRPVFSGIQRHIIATGLAVAAGQYLEEYRRGYFAERDAVLRHYIELHPEDFPPFERKKFSEVLEPWVPIR